MAAIRILLSAGLLALPLWLAGAIQVEACGCGPILLEDQVANADLIVVGHIDEIHLIRPLILPGLTPPAGSVSGGDSQFIPLAEVGWTISVEEYVKGTGHERLFAQTATGVFVRPGLEIEIPSGVQPSCGFAPEEGGRYLLFLRRIDEIIVTTGACTGTQPILPEDAQAFATLRAQIRAVLGEPLPASGLPDTGYSESGETAFPATAIIAAASALAAAALLANGWLVLRRRS
jgi:hypothetical protein